MSAVKDKFAGGMPYREHIKQKEVESGYGSANNIKHGDMDDAFMNFLSAAAAQDTDLAKAKTNNVNLSTQLRKQEDQI